jgi:hypothetical protein
MKRYIRLTPAFFRHLALIGCIYFGSFIFFNYSLKCKAFVSGVVVGITADCHTQDAKIARIVEWVYKNTRKIGYKNYTQHVSTFERFNPLVGLVKKSSAQVILEGGECGNLGRLTVDMLNEINVPANRYHLFNEKVCEEYRKTGKLCNDIYVHAIVEAEINGRKHVIDPTINVIFPYNMDELQGNPKLIYSYLPATFDTTLYSYKEPRGIRWSIIGVLPGKIVYNLLVSIFGKEKTNHFTYPLICERPNLLFSLLLFSIATTYLSILLWVYRQKFKEPQ